MSQARMYFRIYTCSNLGILFARFMSALVRLTSPSGEN
jgi:hypothetical protein